MKLKFNGFLVLLVVLVAQFTFAQERSVSGIVSDNAGMPLPGVSVLVKGTKTGTQSDFDGKFTIKATASDVLVFSYVGMKTTEKSASSTTLNVKLSSDATQLESVVVTAQGIKREKKSLGYASQQIKGSDLNGGVPTTNVANLLQGKAAGVEVTRNTNFGGSTNVIIRGNKSLTGNNQALWVIDGVPIDNSNNNLTSQQTGGGGYDYGNGASDINQEDIESINILKGAAATALYGSRASNGVVMVVTKKGKSKTDDSIGITFSSGFTNGKIDKSTFPEYQNKYGAGYGFGSSFLGTGDPDTVDTSNDASYGDKFDPSLMVYQWDAFTPYSPNYGKATPWQAAKNGPATFFNEAHTFTNSISFEKSTDKSSLSLTYSNFNQTGIMPNSELKKNQLSARFSQKITDKLTANVYAAVTLQNTIGRNSTGYNDNIMTSFRQWWETNVDVQALKNAYSESGGQNVTWNWADPTSASGLVPAYWDNPYFTRYKNFSSDNRTRLISYASLNYEITPWISALGRVSLDTSNQLQEERRAIGSIASGFGLSPVDETSGYQRYDINYQELNYDLMLNFNKKFGEDLSLTGVLGSNIRRQNNDNVLASTIGGLVDPEKFSLANSRYALPFPTETKTAVGVNGLYAQASIGYKSTYYIDASVRRDVSSTLPAGNNSYIYPAVSGAIVFSNLVKADWLNLGKLRVNYAEVGNDAEPLSLVNTYTRSSNFQGQPVYSNVKDAISKNKNPNLKPERTNSFEIGIESSVLHNRLGFDVTYYKTESIDQIVSAAVSSASNYTNAVVNGGTINNEGFEVELTGTPIKSKDFSWDITVNWSNNKSTVVALPGGLENLQLASFQGGVTSNATPGEPYGALKGTDYVYTNGQKTVDQATGRYMISATSDKVIGNINPDWIGGIRNKFNYKNVSLGFLIDTQHGGDIFSLDMYYGLATGLYKETAIGNIRETGIINEGVAPDGTKNTMATANPSTFSNNYGYLAAPNKAFIYDASYVKLREISISYNFPRKMFDRTFIKDATLSILGSNLWIISKNLPYADPESGLSSGSRSRGYSVGSLPTTRDIGFNLTFKF